MEILVKMKQLLAKGANVNVSNRYGRTPLMIAAMFGLLDMAEFLLALGADPNLRDEDDNTALILFEQLDERGLLEHAIRQDHQGVGQPYRPAWPEDGILAEQGDR